MTFAQRFSLPIERQRTTSEASFFSARNTARSRIKLHFQFALNQLLSTSRVCGFEGAQSKWPTLSDSAPSSQDKNQYFCRLFALRTSCRREARGLGEGANIRSRAACCQLKHDVFEFDKLRSQRSREPSNSGTEAIASVLSFRKDCANWL